MKRPEKGTKPFALISIPKEKPIKREAVAHKQFIELTGQIELYLTVVSEYLFIGSGEYDFDPEAKGDRPDVWHTFYRRNGEICIPGTSIKGSIRSIVEAISNSCVSQLHSRRGEKADAQHRRCEFRNVKEDRICPACSLFGTTGLRGRINFSDALPLGNPQTFLVKIGELWEPKRFERDKRRFYERRVFQPIPNKFPRKNFRFVEAVPKGSKFQLSLKFENVSKSEIGLILHALGWKVEDNRVKLAFNPKLGGAKPRCFGAVEFNPLRSLVWTGKSLKDLLKPHVMEGDELVSFLRECLRACEESELLHKETWEELVQKLKLRSETCPEGMY